MELRLGLRLNIVRGFSSASHSESGLDSEDNLPLLPALELEEDQTQKLLSRSKEAPESGLRTAEGVEDVADMEQDPGGGDVDDEDDVYREEKLEEQEQEGGDNETDWEEDSEERDGAGSDNED